jgi:hypothetical protein
MFYFYEAMIDMETRAKITIWVHAPGDSSSFSYFTFKYRKPKIIRGGTVLLN